MFKSVMLAAADSIFCDVQLTSTIQSPNPVMSKITRGGLCAHTGQTAISELHNLTGHHCLNKPNHPLLYVSPSNTPILRDHDVLLIVLQRCHRAPFPISPILVL